MVPLSPSAGELPVDRSWFLDVNALARATPWLHAPLVLFAKYGIVLFAVLLLAGWWWARGSRDVAAVAAAVWAPVGVLLAVWLNQPIGNAVAERRMHDAPARAGAGVTQHRLLVPQRPCRHGRIGHRGAVPGEQEARVLVSLFSFAGLMAFTRVYVGVHYPGDVLTGLLLGAAVSLIGFLLLRPPLLRLVRGLGRTPLRSLVIGAPLSPSES